MSQKSCVRASKVRVRISLQKHFRAFIAARCAAYDFLFARNARIFVARQSLATKTTKIRGVFLGFSRVRIARLACFWGLRVCALLPRCFFGFLALAHCSLGAFSAFSRVRIASPVFFWVFRVCARLAWRVLGFFACAHCSLGAFLGLSSQRDALFTDFCRKALPCLPTFCLLAMLAFCRKALPCGKTTKIRGAFWGKVRVHYGDWSKNYKKIRRGLKTASKIPPLFLTREFLFRKNSRLFIARLRGRI